MVNNRICDITFGGYYPDNEVHEDFWTTDNYLEDPFRFYIKLAGLEEPWRGLATIFEWDIWVLSFFTLVICWILWFLFGMISKRESSDHRSQSLTALNTFALSINVSVFERPEHNPLRLLFMALTLFALNLTCIYSSKLIDVFTRPAYVHQIDTIEEVMELGIPFGGPKESRDWFENDDDIEIFKLITILNYLIFDHQIWQQLQEAIACYWSTECICFKMQTTVKSMLFPILLLLFLQKVL
uniref:Ionotropic glutamate receptor C-terminal domain-containing protein n=1 Tax=Megaselia scalaris TaxID=36166 RepID=T1H2G7_MEGSC